MLRPLSAEQLSVKISRQDLNFADTSALIHQSMNGQLSQAWIGQLAAQNAAQYGLSLPYAGFHLLVLGDEGSGRTSLMLDAMRQAASKRSPANDLVLLHDFSSAEKPLALKVGTGQGASLRAEMDAFVRCLVRNVPSLLGDAPTAEEFSASKKINAVDKKLSESIKGEVLNLIDERLAKLESVASGCVVDFDLIKAYLAALKQDLLDNIEVFQPNADGDNLLEGFLSRYRVNLLVDNRTNLHAAPVIYDADPSFQSLFGGYEGGAEAGATADFMRLRAGNVLRAHGGMLMLHLRDILADQQNGSQILEKLHRVLRNCSIQIEESSGTSSQNSASHFAPEALPVEFKLVLIATRDEYYELYDEKPDFAQFFKIKVDFSDYFAANQNHHIQIGHFVSSQCEQFKLKHFTADAVAQLVWVMQRKIDDQHRISTNFSLLQSLVLESAAIAQMHDHDLVQVGDVTEMLAARQLRYQQPEQQLRESILDGELMINVTGRAVGQINGLTHIDVGDAYFGSPVRISARCYAGKEGVINIDREVEMTGPNHDKGLMILRSWLSANFAQLSPLALTASLVFEQEYHGVEGDSASCAELFALLSALSGLSLPQGIAVTGALNQHGEVMPIGGVNEKIEGFFRLCHHEGLDGTQGVIIPSRNQHHLMLEQAVIDAVESGQFHIYTIDNVLDGAAFLTDVASSETNHDLTGEIESVENLLTRVQATLERFQQDYKNNLSDKA